MKHKLQKRTRSSEEDQTKQKKSCGQNLFLIYCEEKFDDALKKGNLNTKEGLIEFNEDFASDFNLGNTFFHDCMMSDQYFDFLKHALEVEGSREYLAKVTNDNGETLLHRACKLDNPELITSVLKLGCRIFKQDKQRRTALHLAIEEGKTKCIEKFIEIFKNPSRFSEQVNKDIKYLFEIYNKNGYTVLHAAVENNQIELVEAMLKYCEEIEIDACAIEVLGKGDTILHLAVSHRFDAMARKIIEIIPNAATYKNYAGESAYNQFKRTAQKG